ncbi:MAG: hypothetical protein ACJASM_002864 [Salibacteraceae bacterium]|jgi:hypothetical protein
MKKTILTLLFLISNLTFSQEVGNVTKFRKVSGTVNGYEIPTDGILVSYVGIKQAVITDSDGKFCLTIPKNKSVFIEIPICMTKSMIEIKPSENFVEIDVSDLTSKTDKIVASENRWNETKKELIPALKIIYESAEYKKANENICW